MKSTTKGRAAAVCFGLAACFTVFSFRLVQLQVGKHDLYAAEAAEKHVNKQIIYANRGTIQDVNQETLAENVPMKSVVADGSLINRAAEIAEVLAKPLSMRKDELQEKLTTGRKYVILKKHVAENVATAITAELRSRNLRGIFFEQDSDRIYPNGAMLCHVLGFMDGQHGGVDGVEKTMDDYLRGHDGFRYIEHDRTGKEIVMYRGQERSSRDGCNVRLTIDMSLQNIVETELDAAVRQYNPKSAVAILMRPKTGEILALVNRPSFDPNAIGTTPEDKMRNRAITDMVEPGSTFKIVTAAAALNEHLVTPDTLIFCENGRFMFGGRPLRDHKPYADLTVDDVLAKSSNIGAAKLAMKLGDQSFYEYIRSFGFGERTGVALPGEICGMVHPPHRWSKISITRIPMGHEVGVTPLQMITAMCAVANGGHLMMPQIAREITDPNGTTVASFPPLELRTVISHEAASQVRDALKDVVSDRGTAAAAKVAGFTVAGKTGTAQKVDPNGGYMPGKYVVSFIGFLPAEDPEFVGLIMLDDASARADQNYGGIVCAPIFSHIAEKAARYLNLEPHFEEPAAKIVLNQAARD